MSQNYDLGKVKKIQVAKPNGFRVVQKAAVASTPPSLNRVKHPMDVILLLCSNTFKKWKLLINMLIKFHWLFSSTNV